MRGARCQGLAIPDASVMTCPLQHHDTFRTARLVALVLALLGALPGKTDAQVLRPSPCDTDSVTGEGFRSSLQQLYRDNRPAARVAWSRDASLCRQAHGALVRDSISVGPNDTLYVYSLEGAGVVRYGVIWRSGSGGEWNHTVCWFDRSWRKRGICLAM
jgi:hypothetical protein